MEKLLEEYGTCQSLMEPLHWSIMPVEWKKQKIFNSDPCSVASNERLDRKIVKLNSLEWRLMSRPIMYFSLCPRMHLFYRVSDLELGSVWLWRLIRLGMNKVIFCQLITNVLYSLFVYTYVCIDYVRRTSTISYFYSRGLTGTLQQGYIRKNKKIKNSSFVVHRTMYHSWQTVM